MKEKLHKCRSCKATYEPMYRNNIKVSNYCVSCLSKKGREKIHKQMKEDILTKSDYIKLVQIAFNAYIRERDRDQPCISCGTKANVKYDAGHFWPTTYGYLRFHEDNVHKQCSKACNLEKHGNTGEYRPRLIQRIGLKRVEWLDANRHKMAEYSIPELKEMLVYYRKKLKEIKNN